MQRFIRFIDLDVPLLDDILISHSDAWNPYKVGLEPW